jgi:hypothetical protein
MIRKAIIHSVLILMVALPLLGVLAKDVSAASSRVAVIKDMKGTIKVKKAGGSKEFTAFVKMSLNEGDILKTEAGSAATLQFANGSSEDDKMTVAAKTTLTFSKLNNKKGTSTKVSMFNGSAWVDVKSITTKDDEFTLETPTAIMGVRGTHLLVSVDPASGATRLTVAAGVVTASATDSGSAATQNVYPMQDALFTEDKQGDSEITIAPVDLELLVNQSDANIVQAILENAAAIVLENEQYVSKYEEGGIPSELGASPEDLIRFKSNTENLLGSIADQALKSGLLTQEKLDQIITEVKNQSGVVVDPTKNTFILTDTEQRFKEDQRLKVEADKNQADERKKKEEADRKANDTLLKKLEDERKTKEEANNKVAKEKLLKAREIYETQLPTAEKERFETEKKNREVETSLAIAPPSPSPTISPSPVLSQNADLAGLLITYVDSSNEAVPVSVGPTFSSAITDYSAGVPNTISQLKLTPSVSDTGKALVKVDNQSLSNGSVIVQLGSAGSTKSIPVTVTAENGSMKTYIVNVVATRTNVNLALNPNPGLETDQMEYPKVTASFTCPCEDSEWSTVNGIIDYSGNNHDRWTNWAGDINATDLLTIEFESVQAFNLVKLYVYDDGGGVMPPANYQIQYWDGISWKDVTNQLKTPEHPEAALNTVNFDTVISSILRIVVTNGDAYSGFVEIEVFLYDQVAAVSAAITAIEQLPLQAAVTLSDKPAIEAARTAYTILTEASQSLVTNLNRLTEAETALEALTSLELL